MNVEPLKAMMKIKKTEMMPYREIVKRTRIERVIAHRKGWSDKVHTYVHGRMHCVF